MYPSMKQLTLKYLERGSIFGLRALKSQQMKMDEGYQVTENVPEPARLTIIAETNDVLVYSFDIKNFVYLTEDLKVA
jgi:CRP-like cAMP-binding protein